MRSPDGPSRSVDCAAGAAIAGGAHGAPPRGTVTVAPDAPIPTLPGNRLVGTVVDDSPGGVSASHRHAPSAFIYADEQLPIPDQK